MSWLAQFSVASLSPSPSLSLSGWISLSNLRIKIDELSSYFSKLENRLGIIVCVESKRTQPVVNRPCRVGRIHASPGLSSTGESHEKTRLVRQSG